MRENGRGGYPNSNNAVTAEGNGIAVDPAGNVFMMGSGYETDGVAHYIVRKSSNHGATWTTIDDISYEGGGAGARGFTVDRNGNLYTSGIGSNTPKNHYLVRKSSDNGETWTTSDDYIYTTGFASSGFALTTDSAGNVFSSGGGFDSGSIQHGVIRELSCF